MGGGCACIIETEERGAKECVRASPLLILGKLFLAEHFIQTRELCERDRAQRESIWRGAEEQSTHKEDFCQKINFSTRIIIIIDIHARVE